MGDSHWRFPIPQTQRRRPRIQGASLYVVAIEAKHGLAKAITKQGRNDLKSNSFICKMNQMEHNVKIKDYKKDTSRGPLEDSLKLLDYPKNLLSLQEQERLMERFKDFHWERQNTLTIGNHSDRMYVLRHHANAIEEQQKKDIQDYQNHRMKHLEGIKDNIEVARDRFYRRTELDRKINQEEFGGNARRKPLYKIINDGAPIKY